MIPLWLPPWLARECAVYILGNVCSKCGVGRETQLDLHHVAHDGRIWRSRFNGYSDAYYLDILAGVLLQTGEVILLCRKCHDEHHRKFGYE